MNKPIKLVLWAPKGVDQRAIAETGKAASAWLSSDHANVLVLPHDWKFEIVQSDEELIIEVKEAE